MTPIYLDHNATTPLLPQVFDAMVPWLRDHFGNPSSGHAYGRAAHDAVEAARADVAALIGASAVEIVFTSGGTEGNNLAIRGVCGLAPASRRHLVTTAIEHPATAAPCGALDAEGFRVTRLPVGADGRVDAGEAAMAVRDDTALVTMMRAHNETGVLQPVEHVARIARLRGAVVHVDGSQAVGRVPVDVDALGADLLSFSGHKLHAPKGVGALYVRRGTRLRPLLLGAGHERGLRPGTENVASIVALGAACRIAARDLEATAAAVAAQRDRLYAALAARIPDLVSFGDAESRLPNTLYVGFPGVTGAALLAATPEVAASTGSACHDGVETAPAVLVAMGVPAERARGAVRLSLARTTTAAEVDAAAAALAGAWARLARPRVRSG